MALKVYQHNENLQPLKAALKKTLPQSVNLVYRIQHPNTTPDAHILATFPPNDELPHCWAAAYVDRSMRPETELWLFATGEIPGHVSSLSDKKGFCITCKNAVLALLNHISTLPVPAMHPENLHYVEMAKQHQREHPEEGGNVRYEITPAAYKRHLLHPSVLTLGACHHELIRICLEAGLIRKEYPGYETELNKFIFKVADLPQVKPLPEGLKWGKMRGQDMETVQLATSIPRPAKTLLSLESVGVFEESTDVAVAWTFMGLDGSLTTLHTEPKYRGQGIAKAVAAKLFRDHAPELAVDEQGTAWASADVYLGNVQSEAVCRSLGGEIGWQIFWVRIDIARAANLARNL
ncbi:acetyltransferase-like protein [Dendryphion nanum]|uniref:Acetyltransferase-like protein n=1 Tax=Dendryphion nanum TaxID=256645 RepID=A0A9P9DS54_9PLEO|nr:acetyltransferase-like protein [Dendryphion nanum]